MLHKLKITIFLLSISLLSSCKEKGSTNFDLKKVLESRYVNFLNYKPDSIGFPRSFSFEKNKIKKVRSRDWTSGFYAGNLWQLYEITGDVQYKELAKQWTAFVEREKFNNRTHDMGFKVFCSFGKGLEFEENKQYEEIIVKSSKTLISRYDSVVGSIRSWDFNKKRWDFPVIIDNMMNLEMLFEATKITGDSTFHNIAVQHANTTLQNHFRKDNSCYHVVDYSPIDGRIRMKVTHQGFADDTSWARGQAWAIYGFTMAYRYTKDVRYLNQAVATTRFFLNHENLPEDGIPYWDFNAPNIPNEPRDVSAGAIVASALTELYGYTGDKVYIDYSGRFIETVQTPNYLILEDNNIPFILSHSTGNWNKNDEVDAPIVYGDYYYLETLLRLRKITNNK